MLQIYLYGATESGFLDLAPGTILNIESLSEPFDEDLSTGDFSLPLDIPWTDNNRRLTGFAERIENFSAKVKSWRITVFNDMFPELPSAMLTILEKNGSFSYRRGMFSATVSGNKGVFGSLIKGKTLQDLTLGGKISWTNMDSRTFALQHTQGLFPQYPYIAFAPMAIEGYFPSDSTAVNGEFLARSTVNTIVVSDVTNWTFGRPLSSNPTQVAQAGNQEYLDYRTVPFFNLKYVLRKAFEERGFSVAGNFIDNTDFDDLYIFNPCGIENYAPTIARDFNTSITPANHLPKMTVSDFIKGVFQFFNIYPGFNGVNEVQLHYRKNDIIERRILSLRDICSGDFTSSYEDAGASQNGYILNYVVDSSDSYFSQQVQDLKDKNLVATVTLRSDLASVNISRQLTTDDIALVEAENMYYRVADSTATPVKWEAWSDRLQPYISGAGEKTIDGTISTLATYTEVNNTTGLNERRNYVGCTQPGCYINNKGAKVVNDFGLRIFYIKKRNLGGVTVPVSFNHNRDENNNLLEPYSLAWQGNEGIAKSLHQAWQDMKQNAEIVKTRLQVNQKVLQDLRDNNCYELDNVLYLPYKTYPTIPLQKDMEIDLVPL